VPWFRRKETGENRVLHSHLQRGSVLAKKSRLFSERTDEKLRTSFKIARSREHPASVEKKYTRLHLKSAADSEYRLGESDSR